MSGIGFFIVPKDEDIFAMDPQDLADSLYALADSPVCGLPTGDYDVIPIGAPKTVSSFTAASGGTETVIQDGANFYRVHTFTEGGTLTVTRGGLVEYLVVGGGGGGIRNGAFSNSRGGGGGAGGFQKFVDGEAHNTEAGPLALSAGSLAVTVGAGGPAQNSGTEGKGGNSSIGALIESLGGGQGVAGSVTTPDASSDGGSGGGASTSVQERAGLGTEGQGNDGGLSSPNAATGGGGGAGAAGGSSSGDSVTDAVCGDGGDGLPTAITGSATYYAAGGGGGLRDERSGTSRPGDGGIGGGGDGGSSSPDSLTGVRSGTDGEPNTGSGGGGGAELNAPAGSGADGIVILRYRITEAEYLNEVA